jgi:hypothetical protein
LRYSHAWVIENEPPLSDPVIVFVPRRDPNKKTQHLVGYSLGSHNLTYPRPYRQLRFCLEDKKMRLTKFSTTLAIAPREWLSKDGWGQLCGYAGKSVELALFARHISSFGFGQVLTGVKSWQIA